MLRKKDAINTIKAKLNLKSSKDAEVIYEVVLNTLQDGLKQCGAIKLQGIGIIKIGEKKPRSVKVPNVGLVKVPKRNGLFFKPNKDFERSIS